MRVIELYARHAAIPVLKRLANNRIAQVAGLLSGAIMGLSQCG